MQLQVTEGRYLESRDVVSVTAEVVEERWVQRGCVVVQKLLDGIDRLGLSRHVDRTLVLGDKAIELC